MQGDASRVDLISSCPPVTCGMKFAFLVYFFLRGHRDWLLCVLYVPSLQQDYSPSSVLEPAVTKAYQLVTHVDIELE